MREVGAGWEVLDVEPGRMLRVKIHFEILYSSALIEGTGILVDISLSGARIEEVDRKPKIGSHVRVLMFQGDSPLTMEGEVVRSTAKGFAIAFAEIEDDVRRLVSAAATASASEAERPE
jgi:hypothetical protein